MNEKSISALYGDSTINLSEMIWLVLSKWRRILVWILIFSVLFCLLSILGSVNKLRNESFIAQNMATNNHLLQNYESTKTKLEARMQTLSQEINQAHDYEANSSLFAIDPYHVFFCEVSYYIDAGFQIIPDAAYQDPNYTIPVVNAYQVALSQLSPEGILGELSGNRSEIEYDSRSSFISVSVSRVSEPDCSGLSNVKTDVLSTDSPAGQIMSIRVIGGSEEQCDALVDAVESAVSENEARIRQTIHDYKITLLGTNRYQTKSDELILLHNTFLNDLDQLNTEMSSTLDQYNSLRRPSLKSLDASYVLKEAVKAAVLGVVAGFFIVVIWLCLKYVIDGKVVDPESAAYIFRSEVLAFFPRDRKYLKIDRQIRSHLNLPSGSEPEKMLKLAASNLNRSLGTAHTVLVAGTVGREIAESFSRELGALLPDRSFVAGGNLINDGSTIDALDQSDAVILVEGVSVSYRKDIGKELRMISGSGKAFLGFLFLELPQK